MATLNFPDAPSTGDTYTDGNSGFTYEWNGTVWISKDPSTASNIREIDNISSGFDGSDTTFTLQVAGVNVEPANVQQLIISVGGVMQNAGDDYTVSGSTLTFTTAPTSGLTFFGVLLGTALSLNTVADGSVGTSAFAQPLTIGTGADSTTIPGNAVVSGILTAANAYVTGILTAQTLNYNNVTDIYSTGIITAKGGIQQTGNEGLHVSAGITTVGIFTATKAVIGLGVTANNTGIDVGIGVGIVTANSVKALGANFSGGTVYSGKIVGTAATVGGGVTINNTGIDAGNAGIVTAGTVAAPSNMALQSGGSERARIDLAGRLIIGHNASIGEDRIFQIAGTSSDNSSAQLIRHSSDTAASKIDFAKSRNGTKGSFTILQDGDVLGDIIFRGDDGTDLNSEGVKISAVVDGTPGSNDMPGRLVFFTTADGSASPTERLRINSTGGFQFSNGLFDEKVEITAGKLSGNQDIDLADGMVHYFTTQETTTATPNIRINSGTTLQTAMDTGDVCTVTLITTAAAAGYAANLTIDGNAVTEEWVGGSAPSEGSADGLDIYTYTIICIGTGTGDSGFKVIANLTNATN